VTLPSTDGYGREVLGTAWRRINVIRHWRKFGRNIGDLFLFSSSSLFFPPSSPPLSIPSSPSFSSLPFPLLPFPLRRSWIKSAVTSPHICYRTALWNLNVQLYNFTAKLFNSNTRKNCLFTLNIYQRCCFLDHMFVQINLQYYVADMMYQSVSQSVSHSISQSINKLWCGAQQTPPPAAT